MADVARPMIAKKKIKLGERVRNVLIAAAVNNINALSGVRVVKEAGDDPGAPEKRAPEETLDAIEQARCSTQSETVLRPQPTDSANSFLICT